MPQDRIYPKVLLTGIDPWRDDVGANTLPTFFSSWDPEKLALVYTKSQLPDTNKCHNIFRISESEIFHSVFDFKRKVGGKVSNHNKDTKNEKNCATEAKIYKHFRKCRLSAFYIIRDFIWSLGAWKSKELDEFIADFDADVMFFPIYPCRYMNKIQSYIAKKSGLRGVGYIADDNYSYKPEWYNPVFLLRRFLLRKSVEEVIKYCDELLVILPQLAQEYRQKFKIPIRILTKGIDTNGLSFEKKEVSSPIRMVYTGNLFIGRDKTLFALIDAIKKINKDSTKIVLDVYSHIDISMKTKRKISIEGCSSFKGSVPISKVAEIQHSADIVLFIEGLDVWNKNKARLSFSTKLTDYFAAGKCIFAIGSKDIAPIKYLKEFNCAVIATNKKEIFEKLKMLTDDPAHINYYAKNAHSCGMKNHSKKLMDRVLYNSIYEVYNKGKTDRSERLKCVFDE